MENTDQSSGFGSSILSTRNYFFLSHEQTLGLDQYPPQSGGVDEGANASYAITNEWTMVGYTQNVTEWRTFKDGQIGNSGTGTETFSGLQSTVANIGARVQNYQNPAGVQNVFNGSISDIRIYDRALSASRGRGVVPDG